MKKGEIVEGVIERIQFPNKGIMSVEDTKVIVKNTIPGQKVSCRITKKKKGRAEANVLEILEKAPDEIASPCPHFGSAVAAIIRTCHMKHSFPSKKIR